MSSGFHLAFMLIAAITVLGAVAAAMLRNVIHCALSLTITFGGLALMYLQLDAQFAGFSQILVYIGAVAILVVFATLLTREAGTALKQAYSSNWLAGVVIAAAVFALLAWAVLRGVPASSPATPAVTMQTIGNALMGQYVLPLEITAIVLTVALIGAVVVAMHDIRSGKDGAQ